MDKLERRIRDVAARGNVCEVCWTSSFQPCEEGTENAVHDSVTDGWMVCGMCVQQEVNARLRQQLEAQGEIEGSRVTALKDVAKYLVAENNRMKEALEQLHRILPGVTSVDDLYDAIARYGLEGEWHDNNGVHYTLPQKEDFGL